MPLKYLNVVSNGNKSIQSINITRLLLKCTWKLVHEKYLVFSKMLSRLAMLCWNTDVFWWRNNLVTLLWMKTLHITFASVPKIYITGVVMRRCRPRVWFYDWVIQFTSLSSLKVFQHESVINIRRNKYI